MRSKARHARKSDEICPTHKPYGSDSTECDGLGLSHVLAISLHGFCHRAADPDNDNLAESAVIFMENFNKEIAGVTHQCAINGMCPAAQDVHDILASRMLLRPNVKSRC